MNALLLLLALVGPVSTAVVRPEGIPAGFEAEPLGQVRVTHYTHHECGQRLTASGYELKDEDEGKVCAVSRDWWRGRVKNGALIWIEGHDRPCVAKDSMADANRKGFKQRRWFDIYHTDRRKALEFGIQKRTAYILRPV